MVEAVHLVAAHLNNKRVWLDTCNGADTFKGHIWVDTRRCSGHASVVCSFLPYKTRTVQLPFAVQHFWRLLKMACGNE